MTSSEVASKTGGNRRGGKNKSKTTTASSSSTSSSGDSACLLCRKSTDDENIYGKFLKLIKLKDETLIETNLAVERHGVDNDGAKDHHHVHNETIDADSTAQRLPPPPPSPTTIATEPSLPPSSSSTTAAADMRVHLNCLLFASGLSQSLAEEDPASLHGFAPEDILAESRRARRLQCSRCKEKGASVGCGVEKCQRSYHWPCCLADDGVALHFGSFPAFCRRHRPKQTDAPRADDAKG